jgi:hypothetical protein
MVLGALNTDPTQQNADPTQQSADPTPAKSAGPTPKRSPADIQSAFGDLGSKCDTIIPKFDDCKDDNCTNQVALQLVNAINDTKNVIGPLTCGTGDNGVANAIAGVVTVSSSKLLGPLPTHLSFQKITNGLEDHKNKCGSGCPNVLTDYAQVDSSLSGCLNTSFNMCSGLPALVAPL